MRYYVFPCGTLKISNDTPLSSFVRPEALAKFEEVNIAVFYKIRLQDASKRTADNVKSGYKATKKKAKNIKEAIKK